MFVDAAAIVAVLGRETEADRCSNAIMNAKQPFTSAVAAWEAAMALARADRLNLAIESSGKLVAEFLAERGIEIRQLPPPAEALSLSIEAASRYRGRQHRLNLADCFHYACARHYDAAILSTTDEFRFTDLATVP